MPEMILANVFGTRLSAQTSSGMCIEYKHKPSALFIKSCLQHTSGKIMIKPVGLSTSINKDMIVFNNKKLSNGCYISKKKRNPWLGLQRGGLNLRGGMTSNEQEPKPAGSLGGFCTVTDTALPSLLNFKQKANNYEANYT